MKNKFKILSFVAALFVLNSCDNYLDINNDPTQIVDPDPNFAMTSGMIDLANFHSDAYALTCNYWVQYVTQAGNVAGLSLRDQYQINPSDNAHQRDFTGVYSGPLQDLQYASEKGLELGNPNVAAISELLKAYTFQTLVDMFDEVPYEEALRIDEFQNPSYQDGQSIYDDLITKIDDAMALIDPRSLAPVTGDMIFNGNMARWTAFANTLKLKIYLRQTEARASVAQTGVESLDGETFLVVGQDAEVDFDQSNPANRHPADIVDLNTQSFNAASGTIGEYMVNRNDPRVDVYFRRPVSPDAVNPHQFVAQATGQNLGGTDAGLAYYTARGHYLIGTGSAFPFFSAAESNFLQAEGALRGWLSGTAQSYYEAGIRASFARAGLSDAAATLYINNEAPYPSAGTFDQQLEAIMMEKWVALVRQPIEMWNEWKRTGYPDTNIIATTSISLLPAGDFPVRFPFIQRERELNDKTPEFQEVNVPVWWDQ